ncbi:RDD family protein [Micromonospora sp. B11E3]|uniref:RDD family protein n=1 Tax=Micromonospora sp. B11E3 TaxID=3153562 RepID=UPI00325EF434
MSAQPPAPAAPGASGADAGLISGEAVELDVRAARIGSRVLALLLDLVPQAALAVVLALCLAALANVLPAEVADAALGSAFQTVGVICVLVGYPVLWERFADGRTPGKRAVGLRVVRADGGPVGLRQSLIRALVGVAVEWPGLVLPLLSWAASVTVMVTDRRGRRLGDLVAGTMVVHVRPAAEWRPAPLLAPALAGWAYALDLTRLDDGLALAVRQYVTRAHRFAEPARSRLAHTLWAEVAAVTAPPPPPGVPEGVCLATVLAERHRRATHRLHRARTLTAALWPELGPTPPDGAPVRSAGTTLRPAVPSARPGD